MGSLFIMTGRTSPPPAGRVAGGGRGVGVGRGAWASKTLSQLWAVLWLTRNSRAALATGACDERTAWQSANRTSDTARTQKSVTPVPSQGNPLGSCFTYRARGPDAIAVARSRLRRAHQVLDEPAVLLLHGQVHVAL